MLLRW